MFEQNVGNSIFKGFNDRSGIMLCGYEFGFSKYDQEHPEKTIRNEGVQYTFSNKSAFFGPRALSWRYDQRVIRWFELWGHKLNRDGNGGGFEKCILQTNWCNTDGNKIDSDYHEKLLAPDQLENFVTHIEAFEPRVIFFLGSKIIQILQDGRVFPLFTKVVGNEIQKERLHFETRPFCGRVFRIGFQGFERCTIISLPHPSGTRGLSDEYISLFAPEICGILTEYRQSRGF
ncbi:hypothetical protein [Lamprocystis purpurea]|jgi:hypothetical protein|uniref:hypothetical protein n=1 Tax=Lamprocystis purpurea TaxID=61598 RepID=UPI0009FBCACD|nr:hypothetical protein [Lamprocystis purpurea]MBV5347799.1 hypothetical protein [bacterium]